ncbi:BGTF surface domain-containing protein [Halorientalis brevis]|uniref:BGTF surface domain-containing protein n=1 Tax=Halorientalis brevis TaxID=1126241 RepID=A0ABD6CH15_9EURY
MSDDELTIETDGTNVQDGDNVKVTVDDVVNPDEAGDYDIEAVLYDADDNKVDSWTTQYKVGDSVYEGQRLYQGEQSFLNDGDYSGTVELYKLETDDQGDLVVPADGFVDPITFDDEGNALLDTSNLEGTYALVDGNRDVLAATGTSGDGELANTGNVEDDYFQVSVQSFSSSFEETETTAGDSEDLEFDSNRDEFPVRVTSDNLDEDDLYSMFNEDGDSAVKNLVKDDEDNEIRFTLTGDQDVSVNFTDINTGDYTLDFEARDTGVQTSESITVTEEDDNDATFGTVAPVGQGDVAVVPINLENTDEGKVYMGYNDVGFNATFEIEDDNDDGKVTVLLNTYSLGRNDASTAEAIDTLDDSDTISSVELNDPRPGLSDPPLAAASYDINVTNVDDSTDYEYAVTTLQVTESKINSLNSWIAPEEDFDEIDNDEPQDVWALQADEHLTESDSVAEDDTLVWQIKSTGLAGAIESADTASGSDNDDYEEAFVNLMDEDWTDNNYPNSDIFADDFEFRMYQSDTEANFNPYEVSFARMEDQGGLKVVPDQRNGSVFVVMDESKIPVHRDDWDRDSTTTDPNGNQNTYDGGNNYYSKTKDDQTYTGNFTVYDDGNLVEDRTTLTSDVDIVERSVEYETGAGDVIRVNAASGQEVSGTTSIAPGTELDLRLRGSGDNSFLENPKPIVETDGSFTATVDLSDRASNQSFTAEVRDVDDDYDQEGIIGEGVTAGVDFENQTLENGAVTVDSVTMSEGGYVVIHQGDASGDVIGNTEYLSAGEHNDVSVSLDSDLASNQTLVAMAHMDTNDNQEFEFPDADGPYDVNGSVDSAMVTVPSDDGQDTTDDGQDQTTTDDGQDQTTTDDGQDQTATQEPADSGTETTTDGSGPGFTAGLALVALLGAALLAARGRN